MLPWLLLDGKLYLFDDCRQATVTIAMTDHSVFNIKQDKESGGCVTIIVIAVSVSCDVFRAV